MRRKITYNPERDYYTILGIPTHATIADIRQAYRQRVRVVHPDLNPDRIKWATDQLQQVNEAHDVLSNVLTRRDYDRLRWPHVRHAQPRGERGRAYTSPPPDPDRPWWEQVAERAPRGYPFSTTTAPDKSADRSAIPTHRPVWLIIADWLKRRRLNTLSRTWITLVGLWRSPYATILTILAVVLALNMALIVYAFIEPDAMDHIEAFFSGPAPTNSPVFIPASLTPTLDMLAQNCTDPQTKLSVPVSGDVIADQTSVYGTVTHPDLWRYEIALGYLGMTRRATEPDEWITVRNSPANQSIAEQPVDAGLLTETPIDLTDKAAGYYAIRLRVVLRNGDLLEPCDVIVLH